MVSPPALASPMILAFDACACNRNDEKSEVLIGWRNLPSFLPPFASTIRRRAQISTLLNRIDGIAAGIGKPDDLGFRRLCLQQERREVGGVDRVANLAEHHLRLLEIGRAHL